VLAAGCDGLRKTERIDCIFVRVFIVLSVLLLIFVLESLIEGFGSGFFLQVRGRVCSLSFRTRSSRTIDGESYRELRRLWWQVQCPSTLSFLLMTAVFL